MSSTQIRKLRRLQGLCPLCGSTPQSGRITCEVCLQKKNENRKDKCKSCGKPSKSRFCTDCNEAKIARKKDLVFNGKCYGCGADREDLQKTYCNRCLEVSKKRYQNRKSQGLCVKCGRASIAVRCEECALKDIAGKNLKNVSRWLEIQALFESQNRRCSYSGKKLTLGFDASLDHIIPRASGGSDDVHNLQWVHIGVQIAKFDYSETEFLEIIKSIAIHKLNMEVRK